MSSSATVLVLQGGGALGAYQLGAAEALVEAGSAIDWVAGISIGAINAALLAGNAPGDRIPAMRAFWARVTVDDPAQRLFAGLAPDVLLHLWGAAGALALGAPGFFALRRPPAALLPDGAAGAESFYDTAPLRKTLLELVDFDRINRGDVRLSVGAVNVETGNMTWFDSRETVIRPEHIMASGALPPGFPAVEIEGAFYWDGGVVSNTPLPYVLDRHEAAEDLTIYQIDLFSARGVRPRSVWTVDGREKDIRYSSRTRLNTDLIRDDILRREAARRLAARLPEALRDDPDLTLLTGARPDPRIAVAHLIYRPDPTEPGSKDYEFSRRAMERHRAAGRRDAELTLAHPGWKRRAAAAEPVFVFDRRRGEAATPSAAAAEPMRGAPAAPACATPKRQRPAHLPRPGAARPSAPDAARGYDPKEV